MKKREKIASVSKRENACYRNWVCVGELIRQSAREREREREEDMSGRVIITKCV